MRDIKYEYEFDPYGDNSRNLIKGEVHTIAAATGSDFNFIVPRKGPFHRRSLRVINKATGKELYPERDFYFGFALDQFILSGAQQPVYGAIVFNDRRLAAEVILQYQTVGGEFVLDTQQLKELSANKAIDPRLARWSAVVDMPEEFPPVKHRQHIDDFVGMSDVVESLGGLTEQVKENLGKCLAMIMEHIRDHQNPHRITLADLGIDELGQLTLATQEEAELGENPVKYMSPERVKQFWTANTIPLLQNHKDDQTNPHKVTKAQVGLDKVQNYGIATSDQAEAGKSNTVYMTPLRTHEALVAQFPDLLLPHTSDDNNPHGVTKDQVGLGNVPNFKLATLEQAIEGTRNDLFMTPYLVYQVVSQYGGGASDGDLQKHITDKNNPHGVTKDQVGLSNVPNYRMATLEEALEGASEELFVSPFLVKMMLGDTGNITSHIKDKNNPHGVTKSQVGLNKVENYGVATDEDMKSLSRNDLYLVPANLNKFTELHITPLIDEKLKSFAGEISVPTKETIGLGNVENYKPGTVDDILNQENHSTPTYATSSVVSEVLVGNIVTGNYFLNGLDEVPVSFIPWNILITGKFIGGNKNVYKGKGNVVNFNGKRKVLSLFNSTLEEYSRVKVKLNTLESSPSILMCMRKVNETTNEWVFATYNHTTKNIDYQIIQDSGNVFNTPTTLYSNRLTNTDIPAGVEMSVEYKGDKILTKFGDETFDFLTTQLNLAEGFRPTSGLGSFSDKESNFELNEVDGLKLSIPTLDNSGTYQLLDNVWTLKAEENLEPFRPSIFVYNEMNDEWYAVLPSGKVVPMGSSKSGDTIISTDEIEVTKEGNNTILKLTGKVAKGMAVDGDVEFVYNES